MKIEYMRIIKTFMNTNGQWPNLAFGIRSRRALLLRAYNIFLIVLWCVLQANVLTYLKLNIADMPFIDAGQVYTNAILNSLVIQRSCLPFQKRFQNIVVKFASEFNLVHHAHMNKFAGKETKRMNTLCKIGTRIIVSQLLFGICTYNFTPLFNNIQAGMFSENRPENRTFVQCVDYFVPFDYKTDTTGYWIVFAFNWYPSYIVSTSVCIYDLLIFVMLFHISGHLNILSDSLKAFPRSNSGNKASSREYNDQVFGLLKDVIRHYQIIKEFMSEMSEAFDFTLCFYLAFQQVMCCMLLLELSSMDRDAIGRYGMLAFVIFQQLIQTSVMFELIHSQTDSLGDKVYELPWEDMNPTNRKIVLLFLRNVQTPLCLKAGGMVPVGVLTMSTIIRTSFSYYLMLKTLD